MGKCIKGGGPIGIVSEGKAYLIVGDHKPMNDELADYAGKMITVKGKMASNGGNHDARERRDREEVTNAD